MIRGGIARGRGGIARGTPSPGSHLSVSREILRWDGVGSTVPSEDTMWLEFKEEFLDQKETELERKELQLECR